MQSLQYGNLHDLSWGIQGVKRPGRSLHWKEPRQYQIPLELRLAACTLTSVSFVGAPVEVTYTSKFVALACFPQRTPIKITSRTVKSPATCLYSCLKHVVGMLAFNATDIVEPIRVAHK